ncbi:hypothetical protein WJX81_001713 [Elliptochloris bilobata]|uniref:Uncharacterized protein n=1 Tax=Elliptochloris bilobata TaxID=381761 RepID=A0AAW1S8N7_9CHLO
MGCRGSCKEADTHRSRHLQAEDQSGSGAVVLSDGAPLFEGADRETWCRANLPAYNQSHPPPAGFAPMPRHTERRASDAPAPTHAGVGPADAPRAAPHPLMARGAGGHARYVCSDAFFFCFARDRMSADEARVNEVVILPYQYT